MPALTPLESGLLLVLLGILIGVVLDRWILPAMVDAWLDHVPAVFDRTQQLLREHRRGHGG